MDEEVKKNPAGKNLESHLRDLEKKVTPKGLIDEQLNINMSIPPERGEGDRMNVQKVPEPLRINRPSNTRKLPPVPSRPHRRANGLQNNTKKPYPPDPVVRRNISNYRNIKIRMLMLEYLNGADEKRSFGDNFKRLFDFNLASLKWNYIMTLNDILQLVAIVCLFLAYLSDDIIRVFYSFFFSDVLQIGLLVYRILGNKRRENLSKMKGLAPVQYRFSIMEVVMTLLVIAKDVSFSQKTN